MAQSPHLFHLGRLQPQPPAAGDGRRRVDADRLPVLQGLSAELLSLTPGGCHGPIWQANAHILACCLEGEARIAISSPGPIHDRFTVAPNDLCFIQQGFLHCFESAAGAKLLLIFNHERPLELGPDGHVPDGRGPVPPVAGQLLRAARTGPHNPHRMSLAAIEPVAGATGDFARLASAEDFSILDKLALRAQLLAPDGTQALHWHPNCAELGFVARGRARLSVLDPDNRVDRLEIGPGDLYFVPVAWLHSLENISPGETELLIGFNHELPEDIMLETALAEIGPSSAL